MFFARKRTKEQQQAIDEAIYRPPRGSAEELEFRRLRAEMRNSPEAKALAKKRSDQSTSDALAGLPNAVFHPLYHDPND